jgi:hypothetical protein
MTLADLIDRLEKRAGDLTEWLDSEAPYVEADQRHLNDETIERAYWHYGYLIAVNDILRLLKAKAS